MAATFTFLGTGASLGVPVVGCRCLACASSNLKNRRLRCSALLQWAGAKVLLDAGPDLRMQLLQAEVDQIDALLLTHSHYDHIAGVDDLRPLLYKRQAPLPMYMSNATWQEVSRHFHYFFKKEAPGEKTQLHLLGSEGEFFCCGKKMLYFTYWQQEMAVTGFRWGDLAYLSDIKVYTDELFDQLIGVKTLILSALRFESSALHFTVDEAISFAGRVGAEAVYLTHISHALEYDRLEGYLPSGMHASYDGLTLSLDF